VLLTLSSIAGLPAHPLLVHAAVVLVPLAAIAHVVTGWRPAWRRSYAIPVALIGASGAVFAWAASATGEALEEQVEEAAEAFGRRVRFGDHPEQGEAAFSWALVLGLALIGFAVLAWLERKRELPRWAPLAAWAAVVVIAAVATVSMTVAGHSGAELVWKDVGNFVHGG